MLALKHMVVAVFLILTYSRSCFSKKNNACRSFGDYLLFRSNKNCYYNPDMSLEVPDLIRSYIGTEETYEVLTDDGYILKIFRMPKENPKDVILMQHSLTLDSRCWIGSGNRSLAMFLWNSGYEVWLSNSRGTQYSLGHKTLQTSDLRYWNFSFHEMATYDLPSQISVIKQVTNRSKILYVGHSQGSLTGLIYGSLKAQEAFDSIKLFAFMATPGFYLHQRSPGRFFVPFEWFFKLIFVDLLRVGNVILFLPLVVRMAGILFRSFPIFLIGLNLIISFSVGWTPSEADPEIINLDFAVYLKDFAWKMVFHYMQITRSVTRFPQYDYGPSRNREYYQSRRPPRYPIEEIRVPTVFVSSYQDSLTTLQDTDYLITRLRNGTSVGHIKMTGLNHLDYHFGRNRKTKYFEKLLPYLDTFSSA